MWGCTEVNRTSDWRGQWCRGHEEACVPGRQRANKGQEARDKTTGWEQITTVLEMAQLSITSTRTLRKFHMFLSLMLFVKFLMEEEIGSMGRVT